MLYDRKILGIIPARGGSKGVPGKNIRILGTRPLLSYTLESALKSRHLDTLLVTTDHPDIAQLARSYPPVDVPFIRPAHLAADDTPLLPVIQHALTYYEAIGRYFDLVCLLQPTTPFRPEGLIDQCIEAMLRLKACSLVTIRPIPHQYHPFWSYRFSKKERIQPVTSHFVHRRQELPPTYYRDGMIYLSSVGLLKTGTLLGSHPVGFVNHNSAAVNIDSMQDWLLAETLLGHEQ